MLLSTLADKQITYNLAICPTHPIFGKVDPPGFMQMNERQLAS